MDLSSFVVSCSSFCLVSCLLGPRSARLRGMHLMTLEPLVMPWVEFVSDTWGIAFFDNDANIQIYTDAILAFAAAVACPIMFFHMRNFVKVLDDAIKLNSEQRGPYSDEDSSSAARTPESPQMRTTTRKGRVASLAEVRSVTNRDKIAELRRKVMALLITSTLSSSVVAIVCVACAAMQFASHTVPLSWLVYYAITIGIGMFACQLAHSAKKKRDKEASSGGADRRSKQGEALGVKSDSAVISAPE